MKPTKSILDPERPWVPSYQTDIRVRFAAERDKIKAAARTPQEAADKARVALIFNTRRIANTKETA